MLLGPIFDVRLLSIRGGRKLAFSSLQPHGDVKEHRPTIKVVADTGEGAQIVVVRERRSFVQHVSDAKANYPHITAVCSGHVVNPVVFHIVVPTATSVWYARDWVLIGKADKPIVSLDTRGKERGCGVFRVVVVLDHFGHVARLQHEREVADIENVSQVNAPLRVAELSEVVVEKDFVGTELFLGLLQRLRGVHTEPVIESRERNAEIDIVVDASGVLPPKVLVQRLDEADFTARVVRLNTWIAGDELDRKSVV